MSFVLVVEENHPEAFFGSNKWKKILGGGLTKGKDKKGNVGKIVSKERRAERRHDGKFWF